MISPRTFSFFRSTFFAAIALMVMAAGVPTGISAAEVCRLPAGDVFRNAVLSQAPNSPFSSFADRRSHSAQFAAASIQFSDPTYTVSEDGIVAIVLVTRTDDLSGPVTVNYQTSNGTAGGVDYGETSGTLFWSDGDGDVKGFSIPVFDDQLSEGNETVNITLSNPVGGVIGSPGQAVLTIIDNEEGFALSVNDVTQAEGNGANFVTFTVSLSGPAANPVGVTYATQDGTATSPSDYNAINEGQLTFQPGETEKSVSVGVNGDTTVEPDETFSLNLIGATNASIADGTGVATLLNDDAGPTPTITPTPSPTPTPGGPSSVQFSSTTYSVNEGIGTATVTVTRTGSATGAASVDYATSNGTATAGQDYTSASGTLIWSAGDSSAKTFSVNITQDTNQESAETVNLALSNPNGVTLGPPNTAVLTILDDDATPDITINDVTQNEGNSLNSMVFTVSLSNASGQQVSVNYSTENGTASGGSDYVSVTNQPITFSPGETSKQIAINILGDSTVEPDETFFVNLITAINGNITDSQGVGTLTNDDTPGSIQLSASSYVVNENAGTAPITVTRTGGLSEGVTVRFVTVDGTAAQGGDYTSIRTTLAFAPGESTKVVDIPILNDNIDEPDETVVIALESPTGGAVLGNPINAILTIVDDDTAPSLMINNVTQNEGNSGSAAFTFTVSLTGQSASSVSVFYSTADGTASAPSDYASIPQGTLIFDPGQTAKQVTVLVNGDFNNEANETFFVNLNGPVNATILDGEGVGTIANDDVGGAFHFASASYSVGENQGSLVVTVQRSGGLSNGASVNYSTSNGTAIGGVDFSAVSGTLTFAGGQTNATFNVPISADGLAEGDETFTLLLSNAAGGGSTLGVPNTASVTISDFVTPATRPTLFDYDGDGRSDLSVWRPANNIWYLLRGTAGYTAQQFGIAGDKLVPADYDGDRKTDVAVFRPSTGTWFVFMSQSQTFQAFNWGVDGDLPVPTDRDADGKTDLVLFRPSTNTWYTRFMGNGSLNSIQFGEAGDKPVVGDFDADGRGDIAVFRPANSTWYLQRTTAGFFIQTWGATGDIPVPADYDGDGATDLAVFRPATGQWFRSQTAAGFDSRNWGVNGDVPVSADFDGDGKADIALFRPSNSNWYIIGSGTGFLIQQFGETGDVPTQSAFIY